MQKRGKTCVGNNGRIITVFGSSEQQNRIKLWVTAY